MAAVLCPVGSNPGVRRWGFEATGPGSFTFLLFPSGVTLGEFLSLS